MITGTIFPGRYIQGFRAMARLGDELSRLGRKAFVVADPFAEENLAGALAETAKGKLEMSIERFGGESSDEEVERLLGIARGAGVDLVAGVGGGKALDTAKAVAFHLERPIAIVPTIASTDAPCSALSVIYTPQGEVKRYLFLPRNPELVLVDSEIIARAPTRFLVAGMGDALSTRFEALACRRAFSKNVIGEHGSITAYALAELCYETLIEDGVAAKAACDRDAVVPALERIIEANTLLSGIGFESGGLGACHAIHNGFTVLPETKKSWHGEKVAIGVLASLFLNGESWHIIDEVYDFCLSVDLPVTLDEIGIVDRSEEKLRKAAERACQPEETIHNEPRPMTPDAVLAALKTADEEGTRRRKLRTG
jgi:glycerol dehydrogenase